MTMQQHIRQLAACSVQPAAYKPQERKRQRQTTIDDRRMLSSARCCVLHCMRTVQRDATRCGAVRCGAVRCGAVRCLPFCELFRLAVEKGLILLSRCTPE
jgi:hypothetical protein